MAIGLSLTCRHKVGCAQVLDTKMTTSKWDLADLHEYTIVPVIERQREQLARMAFVPWARGASFEV